MALGPAVSGRRYQVGQDVVDAVCDGLEVACGDREARQEMLRSAGALLADPQSGKHRLDIRGSAALQLQRSGLGQEQIAQCPLCTVDEPDLFHSWRRDQVKAVQWSGIVSQAED